MILIKTDTIHKTKMALFLRVDEEKMTINGREFLLADLQARNDFKPFCSYIFPLSNREAKLQHGEIIYPHYPAMTFPFERFSETQHNKLASIFPHLQHLFLPVQVVFYPDTKKFSDALVIVNQQTEDSLIRITSSDHNGNEQEINPHFSGPFSLVNDIIPKCTLEASEMVSTRGTTLTFKYHDRQGNFVPATFEATAKADKGFVSHSKFEVVDGIGKFKFIPYGLDNGEKTQIQVGIGRYTDVCSIDITVSKQTKDA